MGSLRQLSSATALVVVALLAGCDLADPSTRLIGVWQYTGPDGEQGECPDVIEFLPDGTYAVWNECYAADPAQPMVETGSWNMPDSAALRLTGRAVTPGSESPWGEASSLQFVVMELSADALRFSTDATVEGVERYQRLDEAR